MMMVYTFIGVGDSNLPPFPSNHIIFLYRNFPQNLNPQISSVSMLYQLIAILLVCIVTNLHINQLIINRI